MKRLLLLITLCLLPLGALAQNPPPSCWPAQVLGVGTPARWEIVRPPAPAPAAYVLWWFCPHRFGSDAAILWCRADRLAECLSADLAAAIAAPSATTFAALWAANVTERWQATEVAAALNIALSGHIAKERPAPPRWAVALNGAHPTRPAYALVPYPTTQPGTAPDANSTAPPPPARSSSASGRATVGAACDCSVRVLEGVSVYCAHEPLRQTVALCRPTK